MKRIRQYLPSPEQVQEMRSLQFMAHLILEPNLWHFNRHSVSYACLFGWICCYLPLPLQSIPCALLCVWVRCNLPIAIAIIWISNPLTVTPMYYFAYRVGLVMLGREDRFQHIEMNVDWLMARLPEVWEPLVLGSLFLGVALGLVSFVGVRFYWRWKVMRDWNIRRRRQQALIDSFREPTE